MTDRFNVMMTVSCSLHGYFLLERSMLIVTDVTNALLYSVNHKLTTLSIPIMYKKFVKCNNMFASSYESRYDSSICIRDVQCTNRSKFCSATLHRLLSQHSPRRRPPQAYTVDP